MWVPLWAWLLVCLLTLVARPHFPALQVWLLSRGTTSPPQERRDLRRLLDAAVQCDAASIVKLVLVDASCTPS